MFLRMFVGEHQRLSILPPRDKGGRGSCHGAVQGDAVVWDDDGVGGVGDDDGEVEGMVVGENGGIIGVVVVVGV